MKKFDTHVIQRILITDRITTVKIEAKTKQAPSTNYEHSHREKFKSLKNMIVK